MTIEFEHLTPVLGAKILSDPRTKFSHEEIADLRSLFEKYHMLVFRGFELCDQDQIRLCGYLDNVIEDVPGSIVGWVSNKKSQGRLGTAELPYHSDIAFCEHPFSGISLYATDVENDLSSTNFCRVSNPSEWLSADLRERLAGKEIINLFPHPGRNNAGTVPPGTPMFRRPILGPHPRIHSEIMWANSDYTDCVVGLSACESDALLDELFATVYQPEHSYEHSWRMHDLVIWDNMAIHHARGEVLDVGTRTMRRVITGVASMEDQHPGYLKQNPWYGEAYIVENGTARNP